MRSETASPLWSPAPGVTGSGTPCRQGGWVSCLHDATVRGPLTVVDTWHWPKVEHAVLSRVGGQFSVNCGAVETLCAETPVHGIQLGFPSRSGMSKALGRTSPMTIVGCIFVYFQ